MMVGKGKAVEIISLNNPNKVCAKPSNITEDDIKMGTYIDGRAIMCNYQCYAYDKDERSWSELAKFHEPSDAIRNFNGININSNDWWILYGHDQKTKIYDATLNTFYDSFQLPKKSQFYDRRILTPVNYSTIFIVREHGYGRRTYFYNHLQNEFSNGPELKFERAGQVSGMFVDEYGDKFLIVAGGKVYVDGEFLHSKSTEILDLQNPVEWKTGPELPFTVYHASSIQYEDSFLVVGGIDESRKALSSIIKYDVGNEEFVKMPQEMKTPRSDAAAFLIPDDYC